MVTYKESGVDIDAANEAVNRIKKLTKSTFTKNVVTDIGGFGGCFSFPKDKFSDPVLVSSADGVGTKLMAAFLTDKHDTIGQCLVNHCVNDILAVGARPMFFLDYFASGSLDVGVFEQVVSGLTKACVENECSLIGGETAEMPDLYKPSEYDISGTIIGAVEKSLMFNPENVKSGDILIGLKSTGMHTNGYSLARKVLLKNHKIDSYFDELGCTVGDEMLKIHRSYLPILSDLLDKKVISSLSHITGGGIIENTQRVIPKNLDVLIDWTAWTWLPIFKIIEKLGDVPIEDMKRTFNLGIGVIIVVNRDNFDKIINHLNDIDEDHIVIGEIIEK